MSRGGKKAEDATNPIQAAIGKADEDAAEAFDKDMKKDDQIAAAIALRGMAKDGKFAVKDAEKDKAEGAVKSAAESVAELIGKLITAAKAVETAATGTEAVGTVVKTDANAGAGAADANSVKGIAKGIKAIVEAVGGDRVADANSVNGIAKGIKAIVDAVGGAEKLKTAATGEGGNEDAGKLFAGKDGANGGDAKDASKATGAVSAVSGEQIIKAIVDAAGNADKDQEGKKAKEAENPIQAAIGKDNEDEKAFEKMKKDDQIAAAIALRGMAKNGKFAVKDDDGKGAVKSAAESAAELIGKLITAAKAVETAANGTASEAVGTVVKAADGGDRVADANSVKGIAKGIKAIVDAVGGAEKLKAADAAGGEDNKDAGKLFTGKEGDDKGGEAKDASKAAGAVSAVSGEQIIKAIVAAAGKADGEQEGKKAKEAENPIQAAIGKAGDEAKAFDKDMMKKDDQIAAAIALRGMAKDGKFAVKDANEKDKAEGAVKSAAESVVELIEKLITAAKAVATAAGVAENEAVGNVVKANDAGAGVADANSVNGIAKGIKAIVEAVGGAQLKAAGADNGGNEDAGKLFTGKNEANKGGDAKDASKAAGAVSAVSGEQIIKAIVAAAGKGDKDQVGKKAEDATNPIQAAIGTAGDEAAAFEKVGMKKDDQIAAAIALRGMAKDGKFAVKDY